MYANPSAATAMPNGPPGSAMRATVPSPPGTGPVVRARVEFWSVGEEQPTASATPIAAAVRIVGSRLMRPSHMGLSDNVAMRGLHVATRSAQYVIALRDDTPTGRISSQPASFTR